MNWVPVAAARAILWRCIAGLSLVRGLLAEPSLLPDLGSVRDLGSFGAICRG